jgi:hypothetical protein
VDIFLGRNVDRHTLKRALPQTNKAFTVNMEGICGVTYRCPINKKITPIDLINHRVVSTSCVILNLFFMAFYQESPWPWPEFK